MSISIVCENGHLLKVKDKFAGKTGLCPACKVVVSVPVPPLSDDVILELLGPLQPSRRSNSMTDTPKKDCVSCHEQIDIYTKVCPYCHIYVGTL